MLERDVGIVVVKVGPSLWVIVVSMVYLKARQVRLWVTNGTVHPSGFLDGYCCSPKSRWRLLRVLGETYRVESREKLIMTSKFSDFPGFLKMELIW